LSKLKPEDVLEIRKMRKSKEPLKVISVKYGISIQNVCDIDKRRTWKHLKE